MILLAVYILGAVAAVWPMSQAALQLSPYEPNAVDRGFAAGFGVLLSALWPLIAAGWLAFRASRRLWNGSPTDERERIQSVGKP